MYMNNNDLTETIIETNRDVKWICRALSQMKAANEDLEHRVRELEVWKGEHTGRKEDGGLGGCFRCCCRGNNRGDAGRRDRVRETSLLQKRIMI